MSTKDKLIQRFLSLPKDFTYDEVVRLFAIFGFEEYSKGNTSGSRVQFYRNDRQSYIMHKPHPATIIKPTALKQLAEYVKEQNLINEYKQKNMGTLKYKGYTGSVDYSDEDNCLYGKVLGMGGIRIVYEGTSIDELKKDFEGAVDFYLQCCEERGEKPKKAYSGKLVVRMSTELHGKVAEAAISAGTTINDFINRALSKEIDHSLSF